MTAVEWLLDEIDDIIPDGLRDRIEFIGLKSKEMEERQAYSEEDMLEFGNFIFKNTLLVSVKGVEGVFEKIKKK